jgi:formimidoylglutamate deiminase
MPPATPSALWFKQALLPTGWADDVRITLHNGAIASVDSGVQPSPTDEQHHSALPGLSNLHSHAFQRGMAGLAEVRGPSSDNFWTWREIMYHFVEHVGPAEIEAIASLAYIEMLESGFTRVGEFHYLHNASSRNSAAPIDMVSAICAAAERTGIALTLLPSFYAHSNFGGAAPTPGQRAFVLTVDDFAHLIQQSRTAVSTLPDSIVGIAPHSLRAVAPQELDLLLPLAEGAPIHIHAAEQVKEVDDCLAWSGARPVDWLLDHAPVDDHWCLIHATHITSSETERLARSGAVAGLCPITEANLGDGVFPTPSFLQHAGRIGIGTDSNVLIGAAGELRTLEYAQRIHTRSRNLLAHSQGASTGGDLFRAALTGGAQAMGISGGIAIGAPADLFTLNPDHPSLHGRRHDQLLDAFIFAAPHSAIDCVWRAGKKIVKAGRHTERTSIEQKYRATLATLLR